jgi:hypothetical protein
MSHLMQVQTECRDVDTVRKAAERMSIGAPIFGTTRLFDGSEHTGLKLRFPGWEYDAVVKTETGQIAYDNFNDMWGDSCHLRRFQQCYAIEAAINQARINGHSYEESTLSDGTIQLEIIESY